jgi:hypothetical protein
MLPLAGCVSDFVEAILAKHTDDALGNKGEDGLDFEALSKKAEELAAQVKETIEINSSQAETLPGDIEVPIAYFIASASHR